MKDSLPFTIDKAAVQPIYMQLASSIRDKIRCGDLAVGGRIPVERELADRLGVSRGTVKKAYDKLISEGLLHTVQGSGTYVLATPQACVVKSANAKDRIADLINHLSTEGYSTFEIESMFMSGLKSKADSSIKIAAIECSNEALKIIGRQLQHMDITLGHFLLDDVLNFKKGDDVFDDFKLIFTTTTHFSKLEQVLPQSLKDGKITRIAVSPDFETIMGISSIGNAEVGDIGVVTESKRFAEIIEYSLCSFNLPLAEDDKLLLTSISDDAFNRFISTRKCIILPPLYTIGLDNSMNKCLLNYYKNGGKIITFNYLIEKGSLIHLEQLIAK